MKTKGARVMVILKWIQSVLVGGQTNTKISANEAQNIRKPNSNVMIDVAHEAMRSDAEHLNGIINHGQPVIERKKLKEKIKKTVKGKVLKEFDESDLVEEVTERILDAAEFDPYYKEKFED